MVAVLLSLVPPWLAAYLAVRWAWPLPPTPWRALFRASLATGLAVGLSSITYFLWAVCIGPQRPGLFAAELVVFGVLAMVFWRAGFDAPSPLVGEGWGGGKGAYPPPQPSPTRGEGEKQTVPACLRLAFGFVLLCALGIGGWYLWHSRHGDWDAWAIWNLRARFLYRGGEHWTAAFSPLIPWTHPDYPLLLPAAVARGWSCAGHETTLVPQLIACLFGAATVGLLMSVLALLRGPSQGYLGGLVLLATPYFIELTTAQYADVPLGFFILAGVALFEVHDRGAPSPHPSPPEGGEGRVRGPLLAGLLTGLAAWTKNEGSLFLAATVLVLAVKKGSGAFSGPTRKRFLTPFFAGLLPVVLVLVYFKLVLAPVNDLVAGQGWQATRDRLLDVGRFALIAGYFFQALWSIGPGAVVLLAGYHVLLGWPNRPRLTHASAILGLMLAGYAVVYLTTPNHLAWHLHDSVHRLFMQLWPTALLAFFLATATPEEAQAAPAAASDYNDN